MRQEESMASVLFFLCTDEDTHKSPPLTDVCRGVIVVQHHGSPVNLARGVCAHMPDAGDAGRRTVSMARISPWPLPVMLGPSVGKLEALAALGFLERQVDAIEHQQAIALLDRAALEPA